MGSADHEWIDGGITAVPGILAAGLHAGIKPAPARDLVHGVTVSSPLLAGVLRRIGVFSGQAQPR